MKNQKEKLCWKKQNGITLIALVITIVILLILAGISLIGVLGNNGILNRAKNAQEETKEKSAIEKLQLILSDYMTEKYIESKNLEEYLIAQKQNEKIDEVTNNSDKTLTVEIDGYAIEIKEDDLSIIKTEKVGEIVMSQIEESEAFSRANGVIDIVWLDSENNVIPQPLSPKNNLAGLTAITYSTSANNWVSADIENADNNWYNYSTETRIWANARTSDSNAYFVWIPRYAYKITYFDTPEHANAYRADNNSRIGIIGYSNIKGLIDVSGDEKKIVTDSVPTNVIGKVQTTKYADYIPHPAFEFDGSKDGIWVGKFESSGSKSAVKILPGYTSLAYLSVGEIFNASIGVKNTYNLTGDSHMMKDTEWGVVAYLAESKYGRNGTEIGKNSSSYTTGGSGNYTQNGTQSTTGNVYGIYDINGTRWEYIASVMESKLSNGSYYDFTKIDSKYYTTYTNYSGGKKIKGNAFYETSAIGSGFNAWHGDCSYLNNEQRPVKVVGRCLL